MGRSGTLILAGLALVAGAQQAAAQEADPQDFWDGFYIGIVGGGGDEAASLGVVAGTGAMANGTFYFGAEALLAAASFNDGDPYLWLEADGRLGAKVTETMLLFTSAGVAYDSSAQEIALTGGAGAELAIADGLALRAQYEVHYYPSGLEPTHGGQAGVVFSFN